MIEKEYVAFKGQEFQIEWYYSPAGDSQSLNYFSSLSPTDRRKVLVLFKMMGETGK